MKALRATLWTLVCGSTLSTQVLAEFVLKDHVTKSVNWSNQPLIAHGFPPSASNGAFGATATFVGNGHILKSVAGMFAHDSATGTPNSGTPTALKFRLSFFADFAEYLADPFLEAPASPNVFTLYSSVSNLNDWLTVRGTSADGHELFLWEIDVESLGINTIPGQTHLVSLIPETNGLSGTTLLAASSGADALGFGEDWFASRTVGPDTLMNVGSPVPFAAYRITTVPEPSAVSYMTAVAAFALWWSVISRKRNLLQYQADNSHNTAWRSCT